ncbi:Sulphate-transport transmembrane protein ABC transporter [Hoyosella subflava DQS3-9A1]|uniref:Sulphate-transport transmembrane protein ABC transporter n=1 Tax=Hoyosella subflava (strain DSM 45089 / JCM 17490 / NBRC 109087 / DQS3-9A1) TaxID=443218 RepID=F6EPU4_HOYSD|nr:Sulphate-transport transmembrane protein ABC transporter [Hoyosella subflava DQS3-9A1]
MREAEITQPPVDLGATVTDEGRWPTLTSGYRKDYLRADFLAGVSVAAYLIPQVMAYAAVAGLPPVTGLWTIAVAIVVYALLGSSRQLSVGPESTTALMTAVAIGPLAAGDAIRYAALAATLAMLVGVVCLIGWAARLGFLADLLSRPVLVGYMAGIAVLMIVSQLGKVTGTEVRGHSVLSEVRAFLQNIATLHWPTLSVAIAVLLFLLVATKAMPRLPVTLFAVLVASGLTVTLSLRERGVAVVGALPEGVPVPSIPMVTFRDVGMLLLPAVGVAIVGYSDNVLTARAFAARNHYRIDAHRELLALGAANLAAGLVKGFPVSSSASRTAVGDVFGSRTQLHSLVALAAVCVVLVFGGPVLSLFPLAALGALVIYAAIKLIDIREFRRIGAFRRSELFLALATAMAVLAFGVLYGVLAAVALSILDVLRKVARPHDAVLGYPADIDGMHDIDDYPDSLRIPGLVVYRYDAPLFFANADDFRRRALAAVHDAPVRAEWFLLNAEANVEIDITAMDMLVELQADLERSGVVFGMARVKQDIREALAAGGLLSVITKDRIFPTLATAVSAYVQEYEARHGVPPTVHHSGAGILRRGPCVE